MERAEVKEIISEAYRDSVIPEIRQMYDLVKSTQEKDTAIISNLIDANMKLQAEAAKRQTEDQALINEFKRELQTAKLTIERQEAEVARLEEELAEARGNYHRASESYIRLSEQRNNTQAPGAKTDVKINM